MKYHFHLNITYQEFLPYYQGKVHSIVVTSDLGTKIQFPAMHLRKHLSNSGIKGYFCLYTENNKFLSLSKIA
ncbi:DUF2835 domain-containing protein [Thalassotalea sp. PLHSN55]|uniref:DUF2835 domain-containing protein n=1 Tax=Thalassotalea sp. PLHSN55 TaxID=3435888 RepID=UPI003F82788D